MSEEYVKGKNETLSELEKLVMFKYHDSYLNEQDMKGHFLTVGEVLEMIAILRGNK